MDFISLSDEVVVTAVEEWVNGKDPDFFSSGLMALENLGLSASHQRAITSKKKWWISTGNKLGWLLIDIDFVGKRVKHFGFKCFI